MPSHAHAAKASQIPLENMVCMCKIGMARDRNWQVTGIGRQSNALADDQNWKNPLILQGFAMAHDWID